MPINDFKAFASSITANVTSQVDYEALPALINGFIAGKASSAQVNKALRQSSAISSTLAQFIADKADQDVTDNGNLSVLKEQIGLAIMNHVVANLGSAAVKNVGVGANQIPDMNSFTANLQSNGWAKLPSGLIIQFYTATATKAGSFVANFPIPFPNRLIADAVLPGGSGSSVVNGGDVTKASRQFYTNAAFDISVIAIGY